MAQAKHDSITRRAILSGAAATVSVAAVQATVVTAPAAALATEPVAPDPIFAAIEAHIRAYAEFNAVLDDLAVAERAAWNAPRGAKRAANKRLAAAYRAEREFGDYEGDALDRLVATVPETLEGAVAVLRYVRARFERRLPLCEQDGCAVLLASLEGCLCRALGNATARAVPA